jgi:ABC-type multidrug transport system fused ATPase/permease subunit
MDQSLVFYGKADVGQLISRCVNDPGQIQSGVSDSIADLTTCPFQILGSAGFIIFVSIVSHNTGLLFIMIIGSVLIMAPIILIGRKVKHVYRSAYQKIAEVVSRMHEVFSGIMLVKAYNTEEHEKQVFDKVNKSFFKTTLRGTRAELLMSPLTEFVGVTAIVAFFLYCFINHVMLSK